MARRRGLNPESVKRAGSRIEEALQGTPRGPGYRGLEEVTRRTTPEERPSSSSLYEEEEDIGAKWYDERTSLVNSWLEETTVGLATSPGQGPTMSTRVASHQFTPDNIDDMYGDYPTAALGKVLVKFQRAGRTSQCEYGPLPMSVYQQFAKSSSLGKALTNLEAFPYVSS